MGEAAKKRGELAASYTVRDIMEREQLSQSTAYHHAARCLNRKPGARGAVRVPKGAWEIYWRNFLHCDQSEDSAGPEAVPFELLACPVVYVIRAKHGLVKIGSTECFRDRFAALSRMSPVRLHVLAVFRGDVEAERAAHKKFSHYRRHGEWFEPAPDILSWAEGIGIER